MVCKHFKISDYVRVPFKGMVFYVRKSKMPKFRLAIGRIVSGVPHFQVEKILDRRVDGKGKFWYHVKWKFYSEDANSWTKVIDAPALVEEYETRITATLNRGAGNAPDSGKDADMGGVAVSKDKLVVAGDQVGHEDAQMECENEVQRLECDNVQDMLANPEESEAKQVEISNSNDDLNSTSENYNENAKTESSERGSEHEGLILNAQSFSSGTVEIETCAQDENFDVLAESNEMGSQIGEENLSAVSSSLKIASCSLNEIPDGTASDSKISYETIPPEEISPVEIAALNELTGSGLQDEDIVVIYITEKVTFERKVGRPPKKKRAKKDPFVVFKCGECTEKSFGNKGKAVRHALFHQEPSFPCRSPNCDQLFRFKHKMKEHYNRIHKNGMKY